MIAQFLNRCQNLRRFINSGLSRKNFTWLLIIGLSLNLFFSACSSNNETKVLRIGYQRLTDLEILKNRGTLEERLKNQGISVKWSLFQSGTPLMEAMNSDKLDLGGVGEVPPIFAQAAGTDLVYVSTKPPAPIAYGILVNKNSPIENLADLKGKQVTFVKGSSAHFLLIAALKSVGRQITDIKPVYLSPSDARLALSQGRVDAWSIWDPFLGLAELSGDVKLLADPTFGNNQDSTSF